MSEMPKIAVLGATGQVGWELCRCLSVIGRVEAVSRLGASHHHVDLADADAVAALLRRLAPDVVVNAAAYTAVDQAEKEQDLAFALNAKLPQQLGQWATEHGAVLVHYSTDYVFGGSKEASYVEDDAPNPQNVYGETKLAGDQALLGTGADAWLLRVSWVYGARGDNFMRTMLRLMGERASLRVVADQVGAPTWSRSIAEATLVLLTRVLANREAMSATRGLYHLSPTGQTSWLGFASAIGKLADLDCELTPITTSDYPTPARRPHNSRLDSSKLFSTFGIELPNWEHSLAQCLADDPG